MTDQKREMEAVMRIPTDKPTGLARLLLHRPGRLERELLAQASDAKDAEQAETARNDHISYLANVWAPQHPVRARIESRLQQREDRKALENDRQNGGTTLRELVEYRAGKVTREQLKEAIEPLTVIHDNAIVQRPEKQVDLDLEAG